MISIQNKNQGEGEKEKRNNNRESDRVSLAAKRHWELEIKTLQEAPRDSEKLRRLLKEMQEGLTVPFQTR